MSRPHQTSDLRFREYIPFRMNRKNYTPWYVMFILHKIRDKKKTGKKSEVGKSSYVESNKEQNCIDFLFRSHARKIRG